MSYAKEVSFSLSPDINSFEFNPYPKTKTMKRSFKRKTRKPTSINFLALLWAIKGGAR
jgi:hypothetical protein